MRAGSPSCLRRSPYRPALPVQALRRPAHARAPGAGLDDLADHRRLARPASRGVAAALTAEPRRRPQRKMHAIETGRLCSPAQASSSLASVASPDDPAAPDGRCRSAALSPGGAAPAQARPSPRDPWIHSPATWRSAPALCSAGSPNTALPGGRNSKPRAATALSGPTRTAPQPNPPSPPAGIRLPPLGPPALRRWHNQTAT